MNNELNQKDSLLAMLLGGGIFIFGMISIIAVALTIKDIFR
jgi:hypothetical protein